MNGLARELNVLTRTARQYVLAIVAVGLSDEQQIERMYELLDSHQKRTAAAVTSPQQASTRHVTRGTDTHTGRYIYRPNYTVSQKTVAFLFWHTIS